MINFHPFLLAINKPSNVKAQKNSQQLALPISLGNRTLMGSSSIEIISYLNEIAKIWAVSIYHNFY